MYPYPWGHFVGEHSRLRDETRVAVNYKLLSRHGSQPRDTYWPGERPERGENFLLLSTVARLNGQELRGTCNETLSRRNRGHDVPLYLLSGLQSTGSMTRNGERERERAGIVLRLPLLHGFNKTYFLSVVLACYYFNIATVSYTVLYSI